MNIDSLFLIQILTFSFPFFKQIQSYGFQEGIQERMTSASIVIVTRFMFFGQGPPWSLTEVAAEVTIFHRSPTTAGLWLML